MAHIPYGYRIEMGKAVPDEEQAEKLNAFLDGYLSGLSVESARQMAGITMACSCLRRYMRSGIYTGTDYYPQIVTEDIQKQVAEEMKKRTCRGMSIFIPPVPVRKVFKLKESNPKGSAAEKAAARYAAIEAVDNPHCEGGK